MEKNLLQLVLIVKDAKESIKECLLSFKPYISYWCILDTGSTDGTQDIIKEIMYGVEGTLYEEPFEGFSKSRNRALDLAGAKCKYTIMPDDSYIIKDPKSLLNILSKSDANVIGIKIVNNEYSYYSKRIIKSNMNIRYKGTIHEDIYYDGSIGVIKEPTVYIEDKLYESHIERTNKRREYDLMLLHKDYELDKKNGRTLFYLGITYSSMFVYTKSYESKTKAIKYLKLRTQLEEDIEENEEKFICYNYLCHLDDNYKYLFDAIEVCPPRIAEVLYKLFLFYKNKKGLSNLAYMYLCEAVKYDVPQNCKMFMDTEIYCTYAPRDFISESIKRSQSIDILNNRKDLSNSVKQLIEQVNNCNKVNVNNVSNIVILVGNYPVDLYTSLKEELPEYIVKNDTDNFVHTCFVYNEPDYVSKYSANSKNIYLMIHDIKNIETIVLNSNNFRKFIVFSEYDKNELINNYSVPEKLITIFSNFKQFF